MCENEKKQPQLGRTFWDFVSTGPSRGAGIALALVLVVVLCALGTLCVLGIRVVFLGKPIYLERPARAVFEQPIRLSNDSPFTAPSDGFIYVHCPNGVGCRVLMDADRVMSSGNVQQNDSAMFPILRGQTVKLDMRDPKDGDVHIRFFGFR